MRPRKVVNLPVGSFAWGREDDFQVQGRASDSDSVQWCRIEGIARARLLFRWIELLLDWIPNVRLIDISAWADDTALAYFLFLSVWWFIVEVSLTKVYEG